MNKTTWRKIGMVSAVTLMLGLGATTGAQAFEKLDSLSETGSRAGRASGQLKARNLANIINPAKMFAALSLPSVPVEETTAYLRPADGSTDQVTVDFSGNGLIRFTVDAGSVVQAPDGQPLSADGVEVTLTAKAVGEVLAQVVNTSEIKVARSLVISNGVARFIGGDETLKVATAALR